MQVEGPADVTITAGMPDAERKERQVLCLRTILMKHSSILAFNMDFKVLCALCFKSTIVVKYSCFQYGY